MKDALPQSVTPVIRDLCRDALAIAPMYARLHSLGLEPPRGESVHVSGGGENNTPASLAVDSDRARSRRDYARWVASELARAAKIVARVEQGLERNVGPGVGYRQPRSLGSDALVTVDDFTESLQNQGVRLARGAE
jgi:hypothetical protein